MKTLLECLVIAAVAGLVGIAAGWAMDEQIKTHTEDVLRQVRIIDGEPGAGL